ncbi:MAG TPA: hypothetical protein VFF13_05135, partial [archaeon]|nr:hypothetical protein [archaeon]
RVLISALGKVNGVKIDYLYGADYASKGNRYTGETITKDIIEFKRDAILKIAKMFGIPKSKMVFYGDSVTDYTSARMARVRFVPMNPSESLKEEWESFNRTRKSLAIPAKSRAKKAAARTKKRVK